MGGSDPFGVLADAFPKLQMLRVKRMYGEVSRGEALKRMKHLCPELCKLANADRKLFGNFAISQNGVVSWFLTSRPDDGGWYRGQGLWWDELQNTSECAEVWKVGRGVTEEMVLEFMKECGIRRDTSEDMRDWMGDECMEEEEECDTIAVSVCATN